MDLLLQYGEYARWCLMPWFPGGDSRSPDENTISINVDPLHGQTNDSENWSGRCNQRSPKAAPCFQRKYCIYHIGRIGLRRWGPGRPACGRNSTCHCNQKAASVFFMHNPVVHFRAPHSGRVVVVLSYASKRDQEVG